MRRQRFNWALVLAGGGARGLAHIGVLKELEKMGSPKPSLVAGTSMGAIIGGLYACGMTPPQMEQFILEDFDINDYLDSFAFRISGPVGKVIQTGQALASLASRPGIDTGHKLLELFEDLTAGKTFAETDIPFRCNALDLVSGNEIVFNSGSIARAMRASMAFPVFFEPFLDGDMCLVDGGLADNMPVAIARKEGYKKVLAVNVNHFAVHDIKELKNGPQVVYRSIESALNAREENKPQADLTLTITDDESPFSFFKQKEFISLGEEVVRENIENIKVFFKSRFASL